MKQVVSPAAANVAVVQQKCLTGAQVKTRLRAQGKTLKSWAAERGFKYSAVSAVVRGLNRATWGTGHEIAVALGMKAEG